MDLSCFKAYDIRGRVPGQLNSDVAERIGRAFVQVTGAKKVVVGYDIRLSSPEITKALVRGLLLAGADVHDIGLCGTEQIYFATDHFDMDGGIMVTASHNPEDYNGMKLVREGSRPISSDTGLLEIKDLVPGDFSDAATSGEYHTLHTMEEYIKHLLGYVELDTLKPLKIVCNAGNGGAGLVIDQLEGRLPFEFIKIHHDPDGTFPNGVPNPLLEENRASTVDALKASGADLGIAWDGDYDRCFFFDADGRFIEGYYIVGLLAEYFLKQEPGAKVIHDPRLLWNTLDVADEFGGVAIESKTGHAFIKERMRKEDAVYGGEMSAHHYFRDFAYCDSGMIPWLVVANLMSAEGKSLAQLIDERAARFPASGEINRTLRDADAVLAMVEQEYVPDAVSVGRTDGLSVEFAEWRFNLRKSNTEPLVRLNVESRGNEELMREKTAELLAKIDAV